jgi:hypothetical protein
MVPSMGKPKKVLFELIKPDEVFLSGQPYELLAEIRAEQHFDTAEAKIALAWRKGTKPNVDGKIVLGRCVKASDLQRELVDFDFVIVLNKEFWEDPAFDRAKKTGVARSRDVPRGARDRRRRLQDDRPKGPSRVAGAGARCGGVRRDRVAARSVEARPRKVRRGHCQAEQESAVRWYGADGRFEHRPTDEYRVEVV